MGASGKAVTDLLVRFRDWVLANEEFVAALKDPAVQPMAEQLRGLVKEVLTPKGLTLDVSSEQATALMRGLLAPMLGEAQETAARAGADVCGAEPGAEIAWFMRNHMTVCCRHRWRFWCKRRC